MNETTKISIQAAAIALLLCLFGALSAELALAQRQTGATPPAAAPTQTPAPVPTPDPTPVPIQREPERTVLDEDAGMVESTIAVILIGGAFIAAGIWHRRNKYV